MKMFVLCRLCSFLRNADGFRRTSYPQSYPQFMNENQLVKFVPPPEDSCAWELKKSSQKTPDKFYFPLMPQDEIDALLKTKSPVGYMWKCPDGLGTHQLGYDGIFLKNMEKALVVICFYRPRKCKQFYYIEIDDFLFEKERSARKPLTEKRAGEICLYVKEEKDVQEKRSSIRERLKNRNDYIRKTASK